MKNSSSGRVRVPPAGTQLHRGAERDQRRRRVADRRAVGDVAADGAGGAHLLRAEPAQQFAEIGVDGRQRLGGRFVGDGGADGDGVAVVGDAGQIAGTAEMDDLGQVAELLGDPQADIGGAGDQYASGWAAYSSARLSALAGAAKNDLSSPMKTSCRRPVCRGTWRSWPRPQCSESRAVPAQAFNRRIDDRPVAGAAAEIAGDRVVRLRPGRARHRHGRARTGS